MLVRSLLTPRADSGFLFGLHCNPRSFSVRRDIGLLLEDVADGRAPLIELARVMRHHLARLHGDGHHLGLGCARLQEHDDGALAQPVEDQSDFADQLQFGRAISTRHAARKPSGVHGCPRELVQIKTSSQDACGRSGTRERAPTGHEKLPTMQIYASGLPFLIGSAWRCAARRLVGLHGRARFERVALHA